MQNFRTLFGFILVGAVVIYIQVVRAQFDGAQLRIAGGEHCARKNFFFFRNDFLLFHRFFLPIGRINKIL